MTHTIKINCRNLWIGLGFAMWFISTGIFGFGIYVQEVTLSTYDKSGDCHTSFFEGRYACSNEVEKEGYYYLTIGDTKTIEAFFIAIIIGIQIVAFFAFNDKHKWFRIQCSSEQPSNREVKE